MSRWRPGGHRSKREALGGVDNEMQHQSDGNGVGQHGRRGKKAGITCGDYTVLASPAVGDET